MWYLSIHYTSAGPPNILPDNLRAQSQCKAWHSAGTAEATKPSFKLLPAVGEHMLRFQGRQVWISRNEKRSESPLEPSTQ